MKRKKKLNYKVTHVTNSADTLRESIIGIWDRKAMTYIEKTFTGNTGVAIRAFTEGINNQNQQNNLYKWPDDYELHLLGTCDPRSGELCSVPTQVLAFGEQVKVR